MPREDEFVPRPKLRRRKRVHENVSSQDWTSDLTALEMGRQGRGRICRTCHKLQPWRKMWVKYEKVKGKRHRYRRIWFCGDCDNAVRTDELNLKTGVVRTR